ncbi:GMC family oxidoreductase [Coralliovum pocilloporae]|uniref:GMC family oxidoreductase n=1 Tax=Coralliovum pocilloporae TaxID=3066369 RepID=UPI003306C188
MQNADYIIVGAGSAGCVLADKLSADGRNRVLVLEAGGHDSRFFIKMPIGYGRIFHDPTLNWRYEAAPDDGLNGRADYWPRGKVIGGSSSINAMVYFRGLPGDFDDWRDMGNTGWGWEDVKPAFERFETFTDDEGHETGSGPLHISTGVRDLHPMRHVFARACGEAGLPQTDHMNGDNPEGFGTYQITTRNGIRCSAADAFLRPALKRPNVELMTNVHVTRILFEGGKAVGVVARRGNDEIEFRTAGEVILSGGAVNSPQLLQLSGIGPGSLLQRMGVKVTFENDNVGGNLQDHLGVSYFYRSRIPTLNNQLAPWWGKIWHGLRYVLLRRGPLRCSVNQSGGFVRSSSELDRPDLQLYMAPVTYNRDPMSEKRRLMNPDPWPGFLISFQPCRPTSRGRIDLASPDPFSQPLIQSNSLSTNQDIETVVAGGHLMRRLSETDALRSVTESAYDHSLASMSDEQLVDDFRNRCGTIFHPVSTCRMGSDAATSVVDPGFRVRGVESLRVVDASTFPAITSGNTNAPTIMLAHRAADIILSAR